MSNLHKDRLYYGNIIEGFYDKDKAESFCKLYKKNALLYNCGDYYIDIEEMNLFDIFRILIQSAPEDSLWSRMPYFPYFLNKNFMCAFYNNSCNWWYMLDEYKFVDYDSLVEAFPYHKDQSELVKSLIKKGISYDK